MSEPRTLRRHDDPLLVLRLDPGADVPPWATTTSLLSISATPTETSLVCRAGSVPAKAAGNLPSEGPFTAFEVAGPLAFALTGVLVDLLTPLAEAAISVFTVSTFDTDWVLVLEKDADRASSVWRRAGHTVLRAGATPTDDPRGRTR